MDKSMTAQDATRILTGAVIILAIAVVYLLWRETGVAPGSVLTPATAPNQERAAIPGTALVPISGEVESVSGSFLTLKGPNGGTRLVVSGDTIVVAEGAQKSAAAYEADMAAFREYSFELAQNPEQNAARLRTLIAPSRLEETGIALSEIRANDRLIAFVTADESAYRAFKIILRAR